MLNAPRPAKTRQPEGFLPDNTIHGEGLLVLEKDLEKAFSGPRKPSPSLQDADHGDYNKARSRSEPTHGRPPC